jgi:hypothetical protein
MSQATWSHHLRVVSRGVYHGFMGRSPYTLQELTHQWGGFTRLVGARLGAMLELGRDDGTGNVDLDKATQEINLHCHGSKNSNQAWNEPPL